MRSVDAMAARLEALKERVQAAKERQEAYHQMVVFNLPDIEGETIPPDAPPLNENGMRPFRFYLPVKKELLK